MTGQAPTGDDTGDAQAAEARRPTENARANPDAAVPVATTPSVRTRIGEVDAGGAMFRYRGVPLSDLAGHVAFDSVWSLLVADDLTPRLPHPEPFPLGGRTGHPRVDVQTALTQVAPVWGFRPLHDLEQPEALDQLARACSMILAFVAASARGQHLPSVPQREVDRGRTAAERFLIAWRGEADPIRAKALDGYLVVAAEHGMAPSTVAARLIASTGADVGACLSGALAALSGPLHGGSPSRVLHLLEHAEQSGDPGGYIVSVLDSGQRLMGFGHRVYRTEDPRAVLTREMCRQVEAPRYGLAAEIEKVAVERLRERFPHRPVATNLEFWAAVLLDATGLPADMFTSVFACARSAGWSAHILEQREVGRTIRPVAHYDGHPPRHVDQVAGWESRVRWE